jgi:hypothetical protein
MPSVGKGWEMDCLLVSGKSGLKAFFSAAIPAIFVLTLSPTHAQAGFFEDLFGIAEPAARSAPATEPLSSHSSQGARIRGSVRAQKASGTGARSRIAAGSKPVHASLCASEPAIASATPSGLLLYDKTLRAGDVLVTDTGVQVFRGQSACPHTARDFVALSTANVTKSRLGVLLAIEEATRRPNGYLVTAKSE